MPGNNHNHTSTQQFFPDKRAIPFLVVSKATTEFWQGCKQATRPWQGAGRKSDPSFRPSS